MQPHSPKQRPYFDSLAGLARFEPGEQIEGFPVGAMVEKPRNFGPGVECSAFRSARLLGIP